MAERTDTWVKQRPGAPRGFFQAEAAGLNWLAEASQAGGADVVEVVDVTASSLTLERLTSAAPSAEAARRFGAALARTHDRGAPSFGSLPPGVSTYSFGPLEQPITLPSRSFDSFGEFYAEARLRPLADLLSGTLPAADAERLDRVCHRLVEGAAEFGRRPEPASRVHGDLWSGNVMWTPGGVVLIDPAACGHHRLADIAMLMMFGAPHLEEILDGYERAHPLWPGWREEIPLHQLFGVLVHLQLFGSGYLSATQQALTESAALLGA